MKVVASRVRVKEIKQIMLQARNLLKQAEEKIAKMHNEKPAMIFNAKARSYEPGPLVLNY